jgi:phosphatidylserine/phosphatidylglycerophosphate/cardiolipin synthase-like enzyme
LKLKKLLSRRWPSALTGRQPAREEKRKDPHRDGREKPRQRLLRRRPHGADEAAKQIGNVEVIYTGPTTPSAEGQIEIINSLISQKVDAIVISANDPNALVPITKKAMARGIKVISFDSGVAQEGRQMQLNPSNAS